MKSKMTQQQMTMHKFETWLMGNNPEEYCIGFVKGSEAQCNDAKMKYTDNSVWLLSKIVLDLHAARPCISTPIQYWVDLNKSEMILLEGAYEDFYASMPKHPIPPRSVADIAQMNMNRSTDLIAIIKKRIWTHAAIQNRGSDHGCRTMGQFHDEPRFTYLDHGHRHWNNQGLAADTLSRETDGVLQPMGKMQWARQLSTNYTLQERIHDKCT